MQPTKQQISDYFREKLETASSKAFTEAMNEFNAKMHADESAEITATIVDLSDALADQIIKMLPDPVDEFRASKKVVKGLRNMLKAADQWCIDEDHFRRAQALFIYDDNYYIFQALDGSYFTDLAAPDSYCTDLNLAVLEKRLFEEVN